LVVWLALLVLRGLFKIYRVKIYLDYIFGGLFMGKKVFRGIYLFIIGLFFCLCSGIVNADNSKSVEQDSDILPYMNTSLSLKKGQKI